MIVDLHFVAVVDRHPWLSRVNGDANKDAGIIVEIAHFIDDANPAMAELAAGPVQQAHAAMGFDQAIFNRHITGADVFPAGKVLAVEQRLPRFVGSPRGKNNPAKRTTSNALHLRIPQLPELLRAT